MTDLIMPTYGISGSGGTLQKWLKKVGDKVQKGELLAEIETEKAVAELEAPCSGYLLSILVREGTELEPGQTLGVIGDSLETLNQSKLSVSQPESSAEAAGAHQREQSSVSTSPVQIAARSTALESAIKSSPGARRLCAESGIDITKITGTGPQGRIVESDVRAYLERAPNARNAVPGAGGQAESLTPIRRSTAARMSESVASIPHFHLSLDVDAKGIDAIRNAESGEHKPSVTSIMLKYLGDSLQQWPRLNASWRGDFIELHNEVHVNVAVSTEHGLLAPVVRDVSSKSLRELDTELRQLASRAKENRLRLEDCSAGTVTLTNLGMYGIKQFDAIVNPPQCCILAVGSIRKSAFVNNDKLEVRSEMTLTLAVDHRIVDGAEAAQFLTSLAERLENLSPDPKSHRNS